MKKFSTKTKLLLIAMFAVMGLFALPHKAEAATVTVSSNCTVSEAIAAVNAGADGSDGCASTGAYGTSDTISIPAGTWTEAEDLTAITKPVVINGSGKTTTTIDLNNHAGFTTNFTSEPLQHNVTISNLTITGGAGFGIRISLAEELTLTSLIVNDSEGGIDASAFKITAQYLLIENNTIATTGDTDSATGLSLGSASLAADQKPEILVTDSIVRNNTSTAENNRASSAGLGLDVNTRTVDDSATIQEVKFTARNLTVTNNTAETFTGFTMLDQGGPITQTIVDLQVDATTVANNHTTPDTAQILTQGQSGIPLVSGAYISGKLKEANTFTNVTVANNVTTVPPTDNRNAVAGYFGVLNIDSAPMKIVNVTVVGNQLTQTDGRVQYSAFSVMRVDVNLSQYPTITIDEVTGGSSSLNGLIAHNTTNGSVLNCSQSIDLSVAVVGATGALDTTPTNLGYNLSDDQSCTGYTYIPNLYDTIAHEVADNGGPVPTIALLDGSPAIDAGGQVQGISTDARGVTRQGYYSVGAYQGTILAASTTNTGAGQLAKTGVFVALASPLGLFLIAAVIYSYYDYRRHKQPLLEVDPNANYSYFHHLKVVSIPLVRYRLSVSVDKQVGDKSDHVSRY